MIMKKIFLTVVAMLSVTMAFAENETAEATNTTNAYNMNVNMDKLSSYLGLSIDQEEFVSDIHKAFCADMLNAATADKTDRKEMVDKAINKELKNLRYVLTDYQYRKYLIVLNTTMNNRGLNK